MLLKGYNAMAFGLHGFSSNAWGLFAMESESISIGFRAEPAGFVYAVVQKGAGYVLKGHNTVKAPKTFSESERLAWVRVQIENIVTGNSPTLAAVRYPENFEGRGSLKPRRERSRIEGVIMEVLGTRNIQVFAGALGAAAKHLRIKKPKEYLETSNEFGGVEVKSLSPKVREAVFYAISVFENS